MTVASLAEQHSMRELAATSGKRPIDIVKLLQG